RLPRKGVTVGTEHRHHQTVVWVTVEQVQHRRTQWTYRLSQDDPNSSRDGMIQDRAIPSDKLCKSYTELSRWLLTYGCTPAPPDYFAPTREELEEGAESIVRQVTRPR